MSELTQKFRALHVNTLPLRLPNAWDAGSARLFESLGAPAIATTSAGVAWAMGYPDNRALPVERVIDGAANMVRVLKVPLSVDIENGYSDDPHAVADLALRLIDVGVSGINIEDGPDSPSLLAAKIEAIKQAAAKAGLDIFVNARTDVFLAGLVDAPARPGEAIARGSLYRSAGTDGLFVPALHEPEAIKAVVAAVDVPVNVMAWPGLPAAAELGALGVRRLSAGSGIPQLLWGQAEKLAREFLESGRSEPMSEGSMPYPQLQGLFKNL
ncbi:isocitrate lyase/phosphoenolpyruvate mutase family protein [Paraburkholderia acidicola]|uniref:Isocitrate lyase/phosphoenolpyruvate mutase family protein n=1 Tax=Paraburkholderia acidicola TaxID=1912599 RepID=A0ABV1LRJ7_9BURK